MKPTPPSEEGAALPPPTRAAWVDVDLGALARNLGLLRGQIGSAGVLAVIKADAYGHGAVPVARTLAAEGVSWLGVARVDEGIELRRAGVEVPILVLGATRAEEVPLYGPYRLTPAVSDLAQLALWRRWAAVHQGPVDLHLKVDTGMSRLGVAGAEAARALEEIRGEPRLRLTGLLSHLAEADDPESPRNQEQIHRFAAVLALLDDDERRRAEIHVANSSAALYLPETRHSLVRLGLALYGVDPARRRSRLEPVMSVRARLALVRSLAAGDRVGYGGTWTAQRPTRLGVVPVGYGDGYPWRLSNRAEVLVGGRRAPVVGRVSMDMTTVDLTGLDAAPGDEAVLLGRQRDDEITAWELADRAGSIAWEVLCQFGLRLPRRFLGQSPGGEA